MKTQSLATLVAVAASLQGVVATGWHNAPIFSCPGKTPIDKCEPHQHGGFNWGDLNLGSFDHYGGFDFSGGWSCKSSFGGRKRDALLPRTFGSKCISGTAHSDKKNCPKIKAKSVDKFSITHLQVSVEFDCELEFHYTLPGNKVCKQKSHCKKSGTTVKNTQCGGATDVTVVYPKPPKGGKAKCDIGIHSIGFDCPTSTATASTVASTTTAAPVETTPTEPETTPSVPETTPSVPETTPSVPETTPSVPETTPSVPETTPTEPETTPSVPETTPSVPETTPSVPETTPSVPETTPSVPETTPTEPETTPSVPETTPGPVTTDEEETPTATETEVTLTTIVTDVTVTSCPVTLTHVTSGLTSIETTLTTSTVVLTSTKTFCPKCTRTQPSGPEETGEVPTETETTTEPTTTEGAEPTDVPSTTEAGPEPTDTTVAPPQTTDNTSPGGDSGLPCPPVLPQCIKTWLPVECKSNSDIACFCPKPDFTKKLFECLTAFGATEEEIDAAGEFFQGICAPYVPTNPGIVTDCPTKGVETTTKKPHTVPVTTIVIETTVTVPCEPTGTATETTFTITTISTQVTVPQVVLTSTNSDVIVVTGPATVEATQTAALPVVTTPAGAIPVATIPVGFTTSRAGAAAGTGTGGLPQPTQPPFVPGSASKSAVSAGVLGAVMALVALVV